MSAIAPGAPDPEGTPVGARYPLGRALPARWRSPALRAVGVAAAFTSILALLLHMAGWLRMPFTIACLSMPGLILLGVLAVYARRADEAIFLNRLVVGFLAGLAALVAYDLIRLAVISTGWFAFNPFRPIEVFGLLILDQDTDTLWTRAAGWAYHVWNAISFGVIYTLAVGRGRLLYGAAWGLILEVGTLVSYPSFFRFLADASFLAVSMVGHVTFGLVLGALARRYVRL
jgi:hypothetical protein